MIIVCDTHPWMKSYVGVLPHPFFDVTNRDGTFSIENIPVGTYEIGVWHELLGRRLDREYLAAVPGVVANDHVPTMLAALAALERLGDTAEGVPTTAAALQLAERTGVEMPIASVLQSVLSGEASPTDAVAQLLGRDPRAELAGTSPPPSR